MELNIVLYIGLAKSSNPKELFGQPSMYICVCLHPIPVPRTI